MSRLVAVAILVALLLTPPAVSENFHEYSQLDVLVVILVDVTHDGRRTCLLGANLTKIFVELEKARLFYWRNSHMRLHINYTFLVTSVPVRFSGWWLPEDVVRHIVSRVLQKAGLSWDQFDGVVALWADKGYSEKEDPIGDVRGPGGAIYKYSSFPLSGAIAWLFVHEFHHQVDEDLRRSGYPEYPHADYPAQLEGLFGEHFDFNAYMLRKWREDLWLKLKAPSTGKPKVKLTLDSDRDGFPDYNPSLPFDEVRFKSYTNSSDSDGDGLSDREEFMAGIYFASDPLSTDTDGDGLPDGEDPYPLYPVSTYILENQYTKIIEDYINYPNRQDLGYSVEAYWNNTYLTLRIAVKLNEVEKILLYLDLDENGWWHGKANYELVLSPRADNPLVKAHVLDCSEAEKDASKPCLWDDDPQHGGRLISEEDFKVNAYSKLIEGKVFRVVEISVPESQSTGFYIREGKTIGMRIEFVLKDGSWATVFERYSFVYLLLSKSPLSIEKRHKRKAPPPDNRDKALYLMRVIEKLHENSAEIAILVENAASERAENVVLHVPEAGELKIGKIEPGEVVKVRYKVNLSKSKTLALGRSVKIEYCIGGEKYSLDYSLPILVVSSEKPVDVGLALMSQVGEVFLIILALLILVYSAYYIIVRRRQKKN